jgi:cytidylate kinase
MGSLGDEIVKQLAHRLGWQVIDRALINHAAKAAGVPHVALAEIDELGLLGLRPSTREWRAYQNHAENIIRAWADIGNVVIMGRGSQMVLCDYLDVLHVRVVAPLEVRVARLQQQQAISADQARARLEASDKARGRYLKRSYGVNVDDPTLYHLVINTSQFSLSLAVNLIIQAHQEWQTGL